MNDLDTVGASRVFIDTAEFTAAVASIVADAMPEFVTRSVKDKVFDVSLPFLAAADAAGGDDASEEDDSVLSLISVSSFVSGSVDAKRCVCHLDGSGVFTTKAG